MTASAVPEAGSAELRAAVALACLYFALMSGHLHSIDGLLMYRQAVAIVHDGALRLDPPVVWGAPHSASKYGLGLSLLYVPGVALGLGAAPHVSAAGVPYDLGALYRDRLYMLVGAPVHALVVALTGYLVARFIRRLGFSPGVALWGLALFGVGSPALVYARGDWAQPLAGLCWIAALYGALGFRHTGRRRHLWLCCAAVFYGILARPVEGALIVPAAAALVVPDLAVRRWSRASWTAVAAIAGALVLGGGVTQVVTWVRFGSPFVTGYGHESWTTPPWIGLTGALVSPGRGILLAFPAMLLLPLGVRALWRGEHRAAGVILAGAVAAQLLSTATWRVWWGGWNWGPRLFVPALPLAAVLAAIGITALGARLRTWVPPLLLAAGVVWAVPCVVVDLLTFAGARDSTAASFSWRAYPPLGAWTYFERWRGLGMGDIYSADVLWLRQARATGNLSLVPPALLLVASAALALRIRAAPGPTPPATGVVNGPRRGIRSPRSRPPLSRNIPNPKEERR